jgi:voltage-gated potassium channel
MSKPNHQLALLAALLLLIVVPLPITFFPDRLRLFVALAYSFLIFTGIKACSDDRKQLTIIGVLGGLSMLAVWGAYTLEDVALTQWLKTISLLVFYGYLAIQLFVKIAKSEVIDLNVIVASVSGYLMIGSIGGFVFQLLNLAIPDSFKGLSDTFETYDLQYFSYVTLTTVGYGDISPATQAAKSLVLLLALSGQVYLTILIGILIGKYLSEKPI